MKNFLLFIILLNSCMNKQAEKYSKEFIIADGHIDLPHRLLKEGFLYEKNINLNLDSKGEFDIPKARIGGLDCPFMSIYIPSDKNEKEAYKLANDLIDLVENVIKYNEDFNFAYSPYEVFKNFKDGKISLPMGMENGSAIGKNIDNLSHFFKRGIRYITLTHAKNNQICDSSYDSDRIWGGLSSFGESLVKEMNKIGMMIDVSHVSDSAFYDIMRLTKKPVIASHSSPRALTPGFERNLSDEMIEMIAKNDGVILVNFGSSFVNERSNKLYKEINKKVDEYKTKNNYDVDDIRLEIFKDSLINKLDPFADIEDVLKAIDHINNLVGDSYIGFGSDFDGLGNSLPSKLKDASDYVNLIEGLIERGYTKESIEKICYKNYFRVWDANLQNHQI